MVEKLKKKKLEDMTKEELYQRKLEVDEEIAETLWAISILTKRMATRMANWPDMDIQGE